MTSSLNIDFSNISFGTFQTIEELRKQNETKSQTKSQTKQVQQIQQQVQSNVSTLEGLCPQFKTSYSTLSDYIKQIETNNISKELQDMIDKYNKSDIQSALQTIKQKLELIQKQEQTKDTFIVYADTNHFKSSFTYPNTVLYNYMFLNNNEQNIIQNINKYNFTEHNYTNYSRLFFDVDYDPSHTIKKYKEKGITITVEDCYKELIKLFELIHELQDKYNLITYGIIEYNPTLIDINSIDNNVITEFYDTDDIHLFKNTHPEFHKVLSGHIYLNGYTDRYSIMNYMKYLYISKGFKLNIYDTSVYKTTKQAFRMSYSPKVDKEEKTVRPLADGIIPYITQHPELLTQLRMTPYQNDKQIIIEDYKQNEDYKQIKPKIEKKTKTSKPKTISILQYIFYNPEQEQTQIQEPEQEEEQEENEDSETQQQTQEIINADKCTLTNISVVNSRAENSYDMTQKLNLFKALPLSYDEFKTEFDNIEGIDEERKEHIFNKLQYHQDFKTDIILYTYKKHINNYFTNFKKIKKPTHEQIAIYTDLSKILTKIKFYIDKYAKKCFINHTFYDIKTDINYIDFSKEMKILNNNHHPLNENY